MIYLRFNRVIFLSLILSVFSTIQAHSETSPSYDSFPGTIIKKKGKLILYRCTSGGAEYELHFKNFKDEKRIYELLHTEKKFWVDVSAHVYERNRKYHLDVRHINEEYLGKSCHFSDSLKELEK